MAVVQSDRWFFSQSPFWFTAMAFLVSFRNSKRFLKNGVGAYKYRGEKEGTDAKSKSATGALPPHSPKGPSIGQNRFQEIISEIFFNYYKLLKTTKR